MQSKRTGVQETHTAVLGTGTRACAQTHGTVRRSCAWPCCSRESDGQNKQKKDTRPCPSGHTGVCPAFLVVCLSMHTGVRSQNQRHTGVRLRTHGRAPGFAAAAFIWKCRKPTQISSNLKLNTNTHPRHFNKLIHIINFIFHPILLNSPWPLKLSLTTHTHKQSMHVFGWKASI